MQETSNGFSFLACAGVLLQLRPGRSAHVINLLFLFWRVPASSCNDEMAAPHTSFSCFSFLACTAALLYWRSSRSAHVKTLLFLFDVCHCPLATATGLLRTRQNLAFLFLACAAALLCWRKGFSAHVTNLLFLFWRVLPPSCAGEMVAPHTSFYSFLENTPYQLINHLRIHRIIK